MFSLIQYLKVVYRIDEEHTNKTKSRFISSYCVVKVIVSFVIGDKKTKILNRVEELDSWQPLLQAWSNSTWIQLSLMI